MNNAIRSIVYGISILCGEEETEQIDVHRLHKMVNLDLYEYAEVLMLLEQQKVIEETRFVNPLDGYETENGDWHLVQNDYLYKTTQGIWYLKKRGRLFTIVYSIMGNKRDFYDFVVNQNLEILKNIKKQ